MFYSHSLLFLTLLCIGSTAETQKFESVLKNRCEIKLVADYAFFKRIGNGNYANCARYLVNMVERVNAMFTSVDWGLSANGKHFMNMGFAVKEMKILDKASDKPGHYNAESSSSGQFSSKDLIKSFSVEEGTNSTCLTILLSGKPFDMAILGIANIGRPGTGGICAKNQTDGTFWNTGIVTVKRRSDLMITRVVDLVFAHEMGHLWGAVHDDEPECRPDSVNGRFIMHSSSNTGYDSNHFKFSPCSIRSIHRVLYAVSDNCFVGEQSALCGNGILEEGEQCDPGGQLALGHPNRDDPCCTTTCRFRSQAKCSPRHSECCSDTCTYLPRTTRCQPKSINTCKQASYCSGVDDTCLKPSPLVDGTTCEDQGKCKKGECIPYCKVLSPSLAPCTCENVTESCYRCCRPSDTEVCAPITPYLQLPEGAICIHGQCRNHVCVEEATDAGAHFWRIIKDIGANPSTKYADYIVVIVIVVSLVIWCPCGFYIIYKDNQKQRVTDAATVMTPHEEVDVVPARKRLRRNATDSSH